MWASLQDLTFGELRRSLSYFDVKFADLSERDRRYGVFGNFINQYDAALAETSIEEINKTLKTSLFVTVGLPVLAAALDGGVSFFVSFVGGQIYAEESQKRRCEKIYKRLNSSGGSVHKRKERAASLLADAAEVAKNQLSYPEELDLLEKLVQKQLSVIENTDSFYSHHMNYGSEINRKSECEISVRLQSDYDFFDEFKEGFLALPLR